MKKIGKSYSFQESFPLLNRFSNHNCKFEEITGGSMEVCHGDYFLINDSFKDAVDFAQHKHLEGLSIYEIIRVEDGVPIFFEDHFQRFFNSLKQRNLFITENEEILQSQLIRLLKHENISKGRIKIIVNFFSYPDIGDYNLLLFFTDYSFPSEEQYSRGVKLELLNAIRSDPNIKILDSEVRKHANEYIKNKHVYEVLLVNQDGYITEGSRSNFFLLKDNFVLTPPDDYVLQGIARKKVIEVCRETTIECEIRNIHRNELADYQASFITGTSLKILPVNSIGTNNYSTEHELLGFLRKKYEEKLKNYIKNKYSLFH
ncbi:MAG: aminotransferase class IV [Bacteroidales bacterium]